VFFYTRHARDKFKDKEVRNFRIDKKQIEDVVKTGLIVEIEGDVTTIVGALDKNHSLCVVYKTKGEDIKIITFFPAKKGRYERKILQ